MEAIDILRNDCGAFRGRGPFGKYVVSVVWLALRDEFTSPVVPFPNHFWVRCEGLWSCQFLGPMIVPQAVVATKRGYSAWRGDTGTGDDGH